MPSVRDAFGVLGLPQDSSLEQVKSAYKKLALATHPDKNPSPEATLKFQELSGAYDVLLKYLNRSSSPSHPSSHHTHDGGWPFRSHFSSFASRRNYDSDDHDAFYPDEDYDWDSDEDEDEDDLAYYMFLFEELMRGRARHYASRGRYFHEPKKETEEEYEARIQLEREERARAQERRAREEAAAKEKLRRERENAAKAAEQRRKDRAEAKKAEAATSRKNAADAIRTNQQRAQARRSEVFAAARRKDVARVKKGIWEDGVDAAGGEVMSGMEEFVKSPPSDLKETLLHIVTRQGNHELVEWLDSHNAEADERDSFERTPFHIALQYGHLPIIKYFLEAYEPHLEESLPVITPPSTMSLLRLAMESCDPKVVSTVFEWNLADLHDINDTWSWITSKDGAHGVRHLYGEKRTIKPSHNNAKWEEIRRMLMTRGGFTPPVTPDREFTPTSPQPNKASDSKTTPAPPINAATNDQTIPGTSPSPPPVPMTKTTRRRTQRNIPTKDTASQPAVEQTIPSAPVRKVSRRFPKQRSSTNANGQPNSEPSMPTTTASENPGRPYQTRIHNDVIGQSVPGPSSSPLSASTAPQASFQKFNQPHMHSQQQPIPNTGRGRGRGRGRGSGGRGRGRGRGGAHTQPGPA